MYIYFNHFFSFDIHDVNLIRPWNLVKRVAAGTARGMNYLHCGAPAVLHRDLKSANILLDESYNAKVTDFSLSRLKVHERSMTTNCGTVQRMAPEVRSIY